MPKSWKYFITAYFLLRFAFGGAYIFFYENIKNKEGDTFVYWEAAKELKKIYQERKDALHFPLKDLFFGDKWLWQGEELRKFKKKEEKNWENAFQRRRSYYQQQFRLSQINIPVYKWDYYDEFAVNDYRKILKNRELKEPRWLAELLGEKYAFYSPVYNPAAFRTTLLLIPLAFLGIESYHLATFFLLLLSAFWMIFLIRKINRINYFWIWPAFIEPNILFWTSGISKELFLFPAFWTAIVFFFLKPPNKFYEFILLFVSLGLLFGIKPYLLIILPFAVLYGIVSIKNTKLRYAILSVAAMLLLLNLNTFMIWTENLFREMRFIYFYAVQEGGTLLPSLGEYEISIYGFLKILPKAFYNSFLAPAFYDFGSKRLFSVYQSLLICFIMFFLFRAFRFRNFSFSRKSLFLLTISLVLGIIIGLSTPNSGTLLRYRIFHFSLFLFVVLGETNNENKL